MKIYSGFSLLEVVVALFLLSLCLLSLQSNTVNHMQHIRGEYYSQQAYQAAESMAEYLRAHQGRAEGYLDEWLTVITTKLPRGRGRISSNRSIYQIEIVWGEGGDPCLNLRKNISGCIRINVEI